MIVLLRSDAYIAMKYNLYHVVGRVSYWFAIVVANIVATFGLYHYMGRFSGGLRYYRT